MCSRPPPAAPICPALFCLQIAGVELRLGCAGRGIMTNIEINSLAERAAISAIDAHGVDNVPSASVAFDFIQNMDYELEEEVPVLTRKEYRQFVHDYNRHVRRLQASRAPMLTTLYEPPVFTRESAIENIKAVARAIYPTLN